MVIQLKNTLLANAIFSLVSGSLMLCFPKWIGGQLGLIQHQLIIFLGMGLLGFSLFVFQTAFRKRTNEVPGIILGDWGWVLGSALVLLLFWNQIPTSGKWMMDIIAIIVASFAILQRRFLKISKLR